MTTLPGLLESVHPQADAAPDQPCAHPIAGLRGGYHDTPRAAMALLAELEQLADVPAAVGQHVRRLAGALQPAC